MAAQKSKSRNSANRSGGEPLRDPSGKAGTSRGSEPFLIVGVGASAGGLEAIQELLDHLPEETGLALVIAQHRSKDSDRTMFEGLLQRHAAIPVQTAEDGMVIAPDHVYVVPPDTLLGLMDGVFQTMGRGRGREMPIDFFLRSLAADAEERSAAVLLSGSNSDGTLGARAIRERGGLVLAQSPETAAFDTMPRSVIEAGLADRVLAPAGLAEELLNYAHSRHLRPSAGADTQAFPENEREKLMFIVRNETGHSFSHYKPGTVGRRIRRRMDLHHIEHPGDYVAFVRTTPAEAQALFRDLLIEVTHFFRDPEAFEVLGKALAEDYLPQVDSPELRAWVAGCATGEEAYSVAMTLREAMDQAGVHLPTTIYATDLEPEAVRTARKASYPENVVADISKERLQRFFMQEGNEYRVRKVVREMVVFAEQNVLQDPPFSRLDLVCCRNLLIYLRPEAQRNLLARFQFALKEGGLLFLGSAEGVSPLEGAFAEQHRGARLFKRLRSDDARRLVPTRLPEPDFAKGVGRAAALHHGSDGTRPRGRELREVAERFILDVCTPPSVLIDRHGTIQYIHGHTGAYLEPAPGEPSRNLLSMAREGLRAPLTAALGAAISKGEASVWRSLPVRSSGQQLTVDVHVRPLPVPALEQTYFMVSFVAAEVPGEPAPSSDVPKTEGGQRVVNLEQANAHLRTELASIVEQYESAHEEFQSTSEELQSANEELKSSNEELETAKEELESVNEEQSSLNAELQSKVDELSSIRDDMANLLSSTDVATLFLDEELKIKRFTPALERVMSPVAADIGRDVSHLAVRLEGANLASAAAEVLRTLNTSAKEVRGEAGAWFQMRIQPYRTVENVIDGVVVTFIDVTALKQSEQAAREARDLAETVVNTIREPLLILDDSLRVVSANVAFYSFFRVTAEESIGNEIYHLGNRQWDVPQLRQLLEEIIPERSEINGFVVEHEFPSIGRKTLVLNARRMETPSGAMRILLAIGLAAET